MKKDIAVKFYLTIDIGINRDDQTTILNFSINEAKQLFYQLAELFGVDLPLLKGQCLIDPESTEGIA